MPVKFEGESEYDCNFKWLDSRKSASFHALPQQSAPVAGKDSVESGIPIVSAGLVIEPAIQRRKKPISPVRTLPGQFSDPDSVHAQLEDDFFILGDTSKFANNVKYRNSRKAQKQRKKLERGKTYKISVEHVEENIQAPAPIEQQIPPQQSAPKIVKQQHVQKSRKPSPPRPDRTAIKRSHGGKPKRPDVAALSLSPPKAPRALSPPPAPRVQKPAVQEVRLSSKAVQTPETTKTVERKEQNADLADMALQHKAGLQPTRPASIKRVSEYQKQFQWKDGVANSPLLAADQIVHKSASVLKSHVSLPRNSEYRTQFQQPPTGAYKPIAAPLLKPSQTSPQNKKSEPVTLSIPAEHRHETSPVPTKNLTDKEKRLLKEAVNPQKPFPPHAKHRRTKSEYASNFQAPSNYVYTDGAWKGARPPHHHHDDKENEPLSSASSWYNEVLELREKAEEYRKRALGTHFSRMHTAQVLAKNAELWDAWSDESRTVSALSLETGSQKSSDRGARAKSAVVPALTAESDGGSVSDRHGVTPAPPRKAWQTSDEDSARYNEPTPRSTYTNSDSDTIVGSTPRYQADVENESEEEGRIPTPRLKVRPVHQRHHLDVTTPSVGGALLTSPPPKSSGAPRRAEEPSRARSQSREAQTSPGPLHDDAGPLRLVRPRKPAVKQHHRHGYELEAQCTCGADDHVTPKTRTITSPQKSQQSVQRTITPTFGKPTSDRQPLLDEEASEDRILPTKYTGSPGHRVPGNRERVGIDVPRTIDERFGETYITPPRADTRQDRDDDTLSTSVRSVASSCSVASLTLERARNRRDEFWGREDKRVGTA